MIEKNVNELSYWIQQYSKHNFHNSYYEYFYTEAFALKKADFLGKRILDIGCGPQGSLEWINYENTQKIGLDPLANKYYEQFDCKNHNMIYINAHSEDIPFPDLYFDYVSSINSLDHVDDVKKTIQEITRVLKIGGIFLLIVEINHKPTVCEPHNLKTYDLKNLISLNTIEYSLFGELDNKNILLSVKQKTPIKIEPNILLAKYQKIDYQLE